MGFTNSCFVFLMHQWYFSKSFSWTFDLALFKLFPYVIFTHILSNYILFSWLKIHNLNINLITYQFLSALNVSSFVMSENKEQQEDELLALSSIYDDTVISLVQDSNDCGGQFSASLHLPENFQLAVITDKTNGKHLYENKLNYSDSIIVEIYVRKMMYSLFYLRNSMHVV